MYDSYLLKVPIPLLSNPKHRHFFRGKIGESYSLEVVTTPHVTPFFSAVLGDTTALPFIYHTRRCHGFLKTLTKFFRCQKLLILQILTC